MSWFIRLLTLALTIGLALPLLAQDAKKADAAKADEKKADEKKPDDKKDMKKEKEKDDEEKKDKLLPAGVVQGKIMNLNEDKRTMKVEVTYQVTKLDEGEARALMDAQGAYQRAMGQRDPKQRFQDMAKAQNDIAMHSAKLYKPEKKTQQVELSILDDAKIRVATPPIAFNDDGKAKRYTAKELAELKGDPKLPGYTSEYSALATGEMVQVTLVRKKDAKPPVKPMGGVGIGVGIPKPKEVAEDALTDNLPMATMIVIVQQGDK